MSERPWRPQWSPEIERAWADGLGGEGDPRASIRLERQKTVASDAHRTRPLDSDEREEVRTFRPPSKSTGRRTIAVTDVGAGPGSAPAELELIDEVGHGGMGRVFRARQASLDRHIAVKRLTPQESLPDAVAHFESEASIAAYLDHQNIVPVHDMGTDEEGRSFYSMKLIEGRPWDELLDTQRDPRKHIEILLEVANAVAFAHSRGIIHRDIKPQNVMVGEYGEVQLVDWGLAVALRPILHPARIYDLSQVHITCGTPCYMPPEISTGQREWVGTWTDVYMLGATLFELLYGLPPHEESTAIDALKVASKNEWHFPEQVDPALQPYHNVLEPVVAKALATHPEHRHPDASAFADAVRQALTHLDSAELANEAVTNFKRAETAEASAQQERLAGSGASRPPQERYRIIARVIPVLEQALESWPENPVARHYLVEAHLLHAHSSVIAGDLTLAQTHLQALEELPAGPTATADQGARADKLRRRLATAKAIVEKRQRRLTMLWISAAVLTVALLAGSLLAAVLIGRARDRARTERNHLSRLLITAASEGIDADLRGLFEPVRGALTTAAGWTGAGMLDTDGTAELTAALRPLISGFPLISAVMRADAGGREYLLMRVGDGWQTRTIAPGEPAQFQKLDAAGAVVDSWSEKLDYDSKTRPWYIGAKPDVVSWTDPYTFFTKQELGITASIQTATPSGRSFTLGMDLSLADISAFTMEMPDSRHGKVFVLTEDDKVIGLPRAARFSSAQARRDAVLLPIAELGEPVPAAAHAQWAQAGRAEATPLRFKAEGHAWWAGFERFALGPAQAFWIGVVLPESDFEVPET